MTTGPRSDQIPRHKHCDYSCCETISGILGMIRILGMIHGTPIGFLTPCHWEKAYTRLERMKCIAELNTPSFWTAARSPLDSVPLCAPVRQESSKDHSRFSAEHNGPVGGSRFRCRFIWSWSGVEYVNRVLGEDQGIRENRSSLRFEKFGPHGICFLGGYHAYS